VRTAVFILDVGVLVMLCIHWEQRARRRWIEELDRVAKDRFKR
jgi:hypothetical protein